ncbi:MAG TPA: hypothetical protein VD999_03275 [Vitreimonas sp.]|nr:hypothetical protein [Vitreimonas sp.]
MSHTPIISASEIGEFNYCRWCWWRRLQGEPRSEKQQVLLQRGIHLHQELAQSATTFQTLQMVVYACLVVGSLLLVMAICLHILF